MKISNLHAFEDLSRFVRAYIKPQGAYPELKRAQAREGPLESSGRKKTSFHWRVGGGGIRIWGPSIANFTQSPELLAARLLTTHITPERAQA